jgi:RNA polymerase sigma-70 factor, ECF subfamily
MPHLPVGAYASWARCPCHICPWVRTLHGQDAHATFWNFRRRSAELTMVAARFDYLMTALKPTDDELLREMLAGDEEAFAALYRRRQGGIYRFALQMSGSPALSEDVTQEVFMMLMRDSLNYDPTRGSLSAFLIGVARNLVRQRLGREQIYVSMDDEAEGTVDRFHALECPLENLSRGEAIESIRRAVLSLPARYREVVVLCELQELSYSDAAGVLDCAIGTVRSRLHRARAMLLEKMRPEKKSEAVTDSMEQARCFA